MTSPSTSAKLPLKRGEETMAKPKEERKQQFLADWQEGMGNQALGEKYNLSLGGVKALKQRLRAKAKEPSSQVTSTTTQTSVSTATKRMTFWLPVDEIKAIKAKAGGEKRTCSAILREILKENL